jgi:hypothetical protein
VELPRYDRFLVGFWRSIEGILRYFGAIKTVYSRLAEGIYEVLPRSKNLDLGNSSQIFKNGSNFTAAKSCNIITQRELAILCLCQEGASKAYNNLQTFNRAPSSPVVAASVLKGHSHGFFLLDVKAPWLELLLLGLELLPAHMTKAPDSRICSLYII